MEGREDHYWVYVNDKWVCDDRECVAMLTIDQVQMRLNLTEDFFRIFEDNMKEFEEATEALYGTDHSG